MVSYLSFSFLLLHLLSYFLLLPQVRGYDTRDGGETEGKDVNGESVIRQGSGGLEATSTTKTTAETTVGRGGGSCGA